MGKSNVRNYFGVRSISETRRIILYLFDFGRVASQFFIGFQVDYSINQIILINLQSVYHFEKVIFCFLKIHF